MFSEWQICLSLIGSFYVIKLLLGIIIDLKAFITTYVLPTIGLNKGNFDKKYGKWAVVTGCTQGIGRSYVDELAKRGMSVVLISRNKQKLEQVSEEVKRAHKEVETIIIAVDFTSSSAVPTILEILKGHKLDIGVLVNNVGLLGPHWMPFLELEEKVTEDIINVNILSGTMLCHALLPDMVKKGKGAIINIGSLCGYYPLPYLAVYAATKHYTAAFTQAIAAEYADSGVDIQLVEPGQVSTSMTELFEEKPKWAAPLASTFVGSAIKKLGFNGRTCGYWGHSLQNWILVQWLLPDWALAKLTLKTGKKQYEYAISKNKNK